MTTKAETVPSSRAGALGRTSAMLNRHSGLRLGALVSAPLLWLVVIYLASLALLFAAAFWKQDSFTSQLIKEFTWDNLKEVFTNDAYRRVAIRTVGIASAVTILCMLLAVPVAFYAAKLAKRRTRRLLVVAFLVPLWASYLVKAYAWRGLLSEGGVLNWALEPLGLHGPALGITTIIIVLTYLWLPYMILPIYASLERLPNSLIDASGDLGAKSWRTFRSVVFPIILPGIAAGSIFTFSLSMGDYIAVGLVGGQVQMSGNQIYNNMGGGANVPLGAALALITVTIILLYMLM
ncbi:MAG: ABC transporter permease, partial [Candidatus Nanopelagicales bacterium]